MYIGKVTGMVVSTKKNAKLIGCKFLVIELPDSREIVAVDRIGAGLDDQVLVTMGSNAVFAMDTQDPIPVDAVVIGIID